MSKNATGYEAACSFHDTHYEVIGAWILEPGKKITLGKQDNQVSHLQNCVYEWDFLSPCQARGRLWG